jgi:hypothetical protein
MDGSVGPSAPAFVLRTLFGVSDSDLRALVGGAQTMSLHEVTVKRAVSELFSSPPRPAGMRAVCMQAGLLTIKAAEPAGGGMECALKIGTPNHEVTEYLLQRRFELLWA